jgi:micrococcal nuclease
LRTCIFLTLLFCSSAFADSYTARVVGVSDGDSITVLLQTNVQQKIRLAEIDAPERASPLPSVPNRRCRAWCLARR